MLAGRFFRCLRPERSRHAQMDKQRGVGHARAAWHWAGAEPQQQKFPVAFHSEDISPRQFPLEHRRIIDKVGFPEGNADNSSAGDGTL